jgi:hypothetical protein
MCAKDWECCTRAASSIATSNRPTSICCTPPLCPPPPPLQPPLPSQGRKFQRFATFGWEIWVCRARSVCGVRRRRALSVRRCIWRRSWCAANATPTKAICGVWDASCMCDVLCCDVLCCAVLCCCSTPPHRLHCSSSTSLFSVFLSFCSLRIQKSSACDLTCLMCGIRYELATLAPPFQADQTYVLMRQRREQNEGGGWRWDLQYI